MQCSSSVTPLTEQAVDQNEEVLSVKVTSSWTSPVVA